MLRTHTCQDLDKKNIGEEVILSGWVQSRRDHGGVIFLDLRDRYGLTQVTFNPQISPEAWQEADKVRNEWVVQVKGKVVARPPEMVNKKLKTGEIEVDCQEIKVFSRAQTPPFEIAEGKGKVVNEEVRLKYRYLDLRRRKMLKNLILRHKMVKFIRDFFFQQDFLEIETPALVKDTPEGSREYLVPSRIYPGQFYVLPQSPQQLKQLLMVAGVDKYFQVAKCFRDEDLRGDRQPEFTQFEIEMSFAEQEDILQVMENCFLGLTKKLAPQKKIWQEPFPRLTWQEAMEKYGSDKPDLRYDLEIKKISHLVEGCGFQVFARALAEGGVVHALRAPGGARFTRGDIDELTKLAISLGAKGLAYIVYKGKGDYQSPIVKFLGQELTEKILQEVGAEPGDVVFFGADKFLTVCEALGAVRQKIAEKLNLIPADLFAYAWIVDFPLFERSKETGELASAHHPFTLPKKEDEKFLESEPEKVRSYAYDLVLNGVELGGGSLRIHDQKLQKKIFQILGLTDTDIEKRFGHLLKAFSYGVPPHGGIAMGLDRVVMLFADEPNIREVIAFPKDGKARDLMLQAPAAIEEKKLKEYGLRLDNEL